MMGCGSSMDTSSIADDVATNSSVAMRQQPNGMNAVDIVREFVRLDEKIGKLEGSCPGPRMATAEAWVEHLQSKRDMLMGVDDSRALATASTTTTTTAAAASQQQPKHDESTRRATSALFVQQNGLTNGVGVKMGPANGIVATTPNKDLANLALTLGVVGNVLKASTHEDFFAKLSESALHLISTRFYTEILEHTKVRLKALSLSYAELNELYVNHDGIIAFISGGTYMSRLEEKLDAQLETARDIRDKLGSALEQWHICGTLLRACANSSTQALQQWRRLAHIVLPREKIQCALECRNSLQASLISLDGAQLSLPHVELKYVSNRQVLAVKHCNTYMITDIANLSRYEHTSKVFAAYENNMAKAADWLYETFNKTLRKDFEKAEETVRSLAKNLRDHREEIFTAARKSALRIRNLL